MISEPLKRTRSGSMVQTGVERPEPDSGLGPDLPAVWISPQTHQKYTVVYSELIRSLLATSYASLTIRLNHTNHTSPVYIYMGFIRLIPIT